MLDFLMLKNIFVVDLKCTCTKLPFQAWFRFYTNFSYYIPRVLLGKITSMYPHLSAGAHRGKGIGPTHEHFPACDDQDTHIVLTFLLRQERKIKGLATHCSRFFPLPNLLAPRLKMHLCTPSPGTPLLLHPL